MRRVTGAAPQSVPCTALNGMASCTCACTARAGYGRHSPLKAGPSAPPANRRPGRTRASKAGRITSPPPGSKLSDRGDTAPRSPSAARSGVRQRRIDRMAAFGQCHAEGAESSAAAVRGSGLENDPAGDAAGGLRAVRLGCLRERVHRADLGVQVPLVDQAGEFDQLSAAELLDEEDRPDVVPAGGW